MASPSSPDPNFTDRPLRLNALISQLQPTPGTWMLLWAVLIGVGAGVGVVLFRALIHLIQGFMFGEASSFFSTWGHWTLALIPLLGGMAIGLLRWWVKDFGPGLTTLIEVVQGSREVLLLNPVTKMVAASVSLGSGASLGPEGPSVEIGAYFSLLLGQALRVSQERRKLLLSAGAAAGLAAGFNAPIAGVFFALEVILGTTFAASTASVVLLAAVVSAWIAQIGLGSQPAFALPAYEVRSPLELPLYLGLGLLASLMSWLLIRLLAAGRDERVQAVVRRLPPGLPTALGGAALGGMALVFPQVLGVGYDTIEALLGRDGGIPLLTLVALIGVKLVATTVSNATGFVGGGFAPSLFLGAVLGSCYGQALGSGGLNLPVAEPPAYAMVGMAAVLAGSARAPLTALLLLFELTRDIRIVLPLMAAAGLSAALVERWQGIQDPGLMGPDPLEERRRSQLAALPVEEAFEPEAPLVLPAAMTASAALARLIDSHGHCLLVEQAGLALGLVTIGDLQRGLSSDVQRQGALCLADCIRTELVWLPMGVNLDRLEDQLRPNGLRQVPVFELEGGAGDHLPHGLPPGGLAVDRLRGMASRDGMARAQARRFQAASERPSIRASATGSA